MARIRGEGARPVREHRTERVQLNCLGLKERDLRIMRSL
jgi:hypothetical protein